MRKSSEPPLSMQLTQIGCLPHLGLFPPRGYAVLERPHCFQNFVPLLGRKALPRPGVGAHLPLHPAASEYTTPIFTAGAAARERRSQVSKTLSATDRTPRSCFPYQGPSLDDTLFSCPRPPAPTHPPEKARGNRRLLVVERGSTWLGLGPTTQGPPQRICPRTPASSMQHETHPALAQSRPGRLGKHTPPRAPSSRMEQKAMFYKAEPAQPKPLLPLRCFKSYKGGEGGRGDCDLSAPQLGFG